MARNVGPVMDPITISSLFAVGGKLIERLMPDPAQKAQAQLELLKMQQSGELAALDADVRLALGQMDINKAEAATDDAYTKRWRPTVGYILSAALAFQYLINPLMMWVTALSGLQVHPPQIALDDHLWELIAGMLGLAGWRTMDKIKSK